ncbi:hypothetical protein NLJ89_g3030 [Agrocybe chaxingu]|uniref:Molybdate-anion transporter n=1 Tax=Agrocybe chaxingu TaxID=84603 RepID=A0A9W8MX77_9AGAR|nr:hypothetical protein NLJ89_g3030 [Agrocybe chaxingu]
MSLEDLPRAERMAFGYYEQMLALLLFICCLALFTDRLVAQRKNRHVMNASTSDMVSESRKSGVSSISAVLMKKYLVVYAIVMGADWLQGPYLFSLYREQYRFEERVVALLFVTGFVSAGVFAPLVGVLADQHGRRQLCLVFCITYTTTCALMTIHSLPVLLFGRLLGGASTSILFSAFESWLISASNSASLPVSDLSTIMGRATLVNGFVAATAGVVSNQLVEVTGGNFVSPFMASGMLLMVGWVVIRATWAENYGTVRASTTKRDLFQVKRLGLAWKIVRKDVRLVVLGWTQTCFEGSMYLFVFLWVPLLQESSEIPGNLPLGLIFSSFMVSMMLGSLFYTLIISGASDRTEEGSSKQSQGKDRHSPTPPPSETSKIKPSASPQKHPSSLRLHAKLSSIICLASALALSSSILSHSSHFRFLSFCLFEACVGMYYPVQGTLRGMLIANEHRATLSSLFRVPLNVFVVVSLLTGVSAARHTVLSVCAILLLCSSVVTASVIVEQTGERSPLVISDSGSSSENLR